MRARSGSIGAELLQLNFVRSLTSPKFEKGICYGQTDLPVADTFVEEAEVIQQQLPN